MDIHVYVHAVSDPKLDQIIGLLKTIITKENILMATIDDVLADVQAESEVDDSLIALTTAIKAQLDQLLQGQLPPDVQAKVDSIFSGLEANKAKVAAAVVANTPSAPTT